MSHSRVTTLAAALKTGVVVALAASLAAAACGSTTTTSVAPTPVRCAISIAPPSDALPPRGGAAQIAIATEAECSWSVSSDVPWMTGFAPASGFGAANVAFNVAPNNGPPRSGTLTVEDERVVISQASGCSYTIQPTTRVAGAGGESLTAAVTTSSGCTWTATSGAAWITITSGASGSGNGTVRFTVAPNTSPARTGTLTIAGRTLTVSQASGCTYAVQPIAVPASAAGGPASVAVTTGSGCTWSVVSAASWITVPAPSSSGTGTGQAQFTVAPNAGPQRTGTVTVAGRAVTVTQASGCTYVLSPLSMSFGVLGGTGVVTVVTAPGCAWTASAGVSWIAIVRGVNGNGSGEFTFIVAPSFARRTGSVHAGGQAVTVRQND